MVEVPFDYLEEARKLLSFTRRVCEAEGNYESFQSSCSRRKNLSEKEVLKDESVVPNEGQSIFLANYDEHMQFHRASPSVRESNLQSSVEEIPELPKRHHEGEREEGNEIIRNSDFVKLSDSEDEISTTSTQRENNELVNNFSSIPENYFLQGAKSAKIQEEASDISNADIVQNTMVIPERPSTQLKGKDNVSQKVRNSSIPNDVIDLTSAGKAHAINIHSKKRNTQINKKKKLIESAQRSSDLLFTLLGETAEVRNDMKSSGNNPLFSAPSLPPVCALPPLPPPPPPPTTGTNHIYGALRHANGGTFRPTVIEMNNSTSLSTNSEGSSYARQNFTFQTANNLCSSSSVPSGSIPHATNQLSNIEWNPTRNNSLHPQNPMFQVAQTSSPSHSIQPTTTNNYMADFLTGEKNATDHRGASNQPYSQSNGSTRKRKRHFPAIDNKKSKERSSLAPKGKKKLPKSLKRINGMVKKYDLESID